MAILWCGGEDVDFPGASVVTSASFIRAGYSRCAVGAASTPILSSVGFAGVTSAWLSCRSASYAGTNFHVIGLTDSSGKGIYIGEGSANYGKCAIYSYNGTTATLLAEESTTTSFSSLGTMVKLDMRISNLGSTGNVKLYAGGALIIDYTGNLTASGITSITNVAIRGSNGPYLSEIIVADEDTRDMSVVTLAPSAAGDGNAWAGAYTDISETTTNDTTVISTNTTAQDAQFNVSDLPAALSIKGVRVYARALRTSDSTPTAISLGVKTGGTVNVGAAQSLSTSWAVKDRIMQANPVTSSVWTASDINGLQINFGSA